MMKAPRFWYKQNPGLTALALAPASLLYGAIVFCKPRQEKKLSKPVICVGNVTVGGTGKTPVVTAIAGLLKDSGRNPHILLRGYGGTEKGPLTVAPSSHTPAEVGDEALLHARMTPTWVSIDRPAGAGAAIKQGADIVLMDDGFQNFSLHKDISFIVIDGETGIGNGMLLPAGPLREPLGEALKRAHAVILLGEDRTGIAAKIEKPLFRGHIEGNLTPFKGEKLYAFAGIGRPEKFRDTLIKGGIELAGFESFPDHHAYSVSDLEKITENAQGFSIVTTEKDHVRLPKEYQEKIRAVPVSVAWKDEKTLSEFLQTRLAS